MFNILFSLFVRLPWRSELKQEGAMVWRTH